MLAAAGGLLADHGYAGTTIAAVAREAGVAPETVYAAFGNKRTLVGELVQTASGAATPHRRPPRPAPAPRPRPPTGTSRYACSRPTSWSGWSGSARCCTRSPRLLPSRSWPSCSRSVDRDRLDGLRRFVGVLERGGPLRTDAEAATETVWALASPELHSMLTARRGWSRERYCDWLADTLVSALLP